MTSPFLDVRNLQQRFGEQVILQDCSLTLARGQVLAILGRSGCGKTTLLKIIAGLLEGFTGTVHLGGEDIGHWSPERRNIVYLSQEPLLFPHLSVFENVAFGLRLRRLTEGDIRQRTEAMLRSIGLIEHAQKRPHQLSGGQKQRVAFGRAFIVGANVLLLDEPFGALDSETRATMQQFFQGMARAQGLTAVFVTHDLKEAVRMGDQLAYMEHGQLRTYASIADFLQDERTGATAERAFWRELDEEKER